jgi:GTPase Era involved in 16S rRNA processing
MAVGDLVFVDFPGFDDTHRIDVDILKTAADTHGRSDVDILMMVADWLRSTYAFVCG